MAASPCTAVESVFSHLGSPECEEGHIRRLLRFTEYRIFREAAVLSCQSAFKFDPALAIAGSTSCSGCEGIVMNHKKLQRLSPLAELSAISRSLSAVVQRRRRSRPERTVTFVMGAP
jgi:hypothetical protein